MCDDEELMSACADGDDGAFSLLYARHERLLRAFFLRHVRSAADADDLVQQVFLNLHRYRAEYRHGAAFRPWLVTIGRNLLRDRVRRTGRVRETQVDASTLEGMGSVAPPDYEGLRALRRALELLAPSQRHIVERHWFEGISFEEVAFDLGITPLAARLRAHRAYAELRERLAPEHAFASSRSTAKATVVELRRADDADAPSSHVA